MCVHVCVCIEIGGIGYSDKLTCEDLTRQKTKQINKKQNESRSQDREELHPNR